MSQLKNKSEINRVAADYLQNQSLYPSVIHCAYYSCFQLMKHIVLNTIEITEAEIANEVRNTPNGSHEVVINNIINYLRTNNKEWRTFNTDITQLKRLRVSADYENVSIDISKGRASITLSNKVVNHLRSNIRIT